MLTQEMETHFLCSNYTGGALLLSLHCPSLNSALCYLQPETHNKARLPYVRSSVSHILSLQITSWEWTWTQCESRLRSRRPRGLCSHLTGKPIRIKCREKRSNENRSKKRRQLTSAKGWQPKRSQGMFTFQKPCPLSLEPEITNLYCKLVGPFTFTAVATWIVSVGILLVCRKGRLVSTKPRCNLSADMALLSSTKITARAAVLMPACYSWGQPGRQILFNSMSLASVKLALERRVFSITLGLYITGRFSSHIPSAVYFTDPAWGRVSQTEWD